MGDFWYYPITQYQSTHFRTLQYFSMFLFVYVLWYCLFPSTGVLGSPLRGSLSATKILGPDKIRVPGGKRLPGKNPVPGIFFLPGEIRLPGTKSVQ